MLPPGLHDVDQLGPLVEQPQQSGCHAADLAAGRPSAQRVRVYLAHECELTPGNTQTVDNLDSFLPGHRTNVIKTRRNVNILRLTLLMAQVDAPIFAH